MSRAGPGHIPESTSPQPHRRKYEGSRIQFYTFHATLIVK